MARAFLAAVPLALVLVAAVVVPVALTPGTFGFRSWPASPAAPPRENALVAEPQLPSAGATHRGADLVRPKRPAPGRPSAQVAAVSRERRPAHTPRPAHEVVAAAPQPAPRHPAPTRPPSSGDAPTPAPAPSPPTPAPPAQTPVAQVDPPPARPAAPHVEARPAAPVPEPVPAARDDDGAGLRGHRGVWSRPGRDRGHRRGWRGGDDYDGCPFGHRDDKN